MKIIRVFLLIGLSVLLVTSCSKDFLDTEPTDAVAKDVIFQTTDGAYVSLNGMYRWFYEFGITDGGHDDYGYKSLGLKVDLMGGDMKVFSRGYGWYITDYNYTARGQVTDGSSADLSYNLNYDIIYNSNVILEEVEGLEGSREDKDNIAGQAHALRAFAYFWLAQWHASTYVGNESAPCCPLKVESSDTHVGVSTVGEVYDVIVSDLDAAIDLMEGNALATQAGGRESKSWIDLSVVYGLRARVALVMEDWTTAIAMAQNARAEYPLMDASAYTAGFNDVNNAEWMWGMDINDEQATIYASFFSHLDPIKVSYASLGLQKQLPRYLYDTIPDTDVRKQLFVAPDDSVTVDYSGAPVPTYTCVKFIAGNTWAVDYVFMRASEMYLIEAEAAAEAGQNGVAQAALQAIYDVRNPGQMVTNTGQALIDEIRLQRRLELWGEGFSLFDIKRWKIPMVRIDHDPTLCVVTNLPANSPEFNMRIPQREIDANNEITDADQID